MINQINSLQGYSFTPISSQPDAQPLETIDDFFSPSAQDAVYLSFDAKTQQKIEDIETQLDEIFGAPKPLTKEELQQEEAIFKQIDSILDQSEELTLSKQDQEKADKIFAQLDKLYANGSLSEEQEKQVATLEKELDEVFSAYQPKELTEEENKKLAALFSQLDKLHGFKSPSEEQLNKADTLFAELDKLFKSANEKPLTYEGLAKR